MGAERSLCQLDESSVREPRGVTVEIGGVPIQLRPSRPDFHEVISKRYSGFLNSSAPPAYKFDILLENQSQALDADLRLLNRGPLWRLERGDFRAEWDSQSRRGWVRQAANPYSIDTVLRIVHSLVLAEQGGFLLHASSAVRNGRAFLFTGISGAGKTTISRLAPPDAILLTDEISYVRRTGMEYRAYGTPFAGELEKPGANVSAPVSAVYLLEKGSENRVGVVEPLAAARSLLRNILFFAHDYDLVKRLFDSAVEFVSQVRVSRLVFTPDARVWELIG
jgi:hypothetical protein